VRIVSGGSAAVVGIARIVPGVVSRGSRGAGASGRAVRWLEASGARRGNPDAVVFARSITRGRSRRGSGGRGVRPRILERLPRSIVVRRGTPAEQRDQEHAVSPT